MFSSLLPGLSGIDQVAPDWIKVQSFVSVLVRSFLSDVDGLKDFSFFFSRTLTLSQSIWWVFLLLVTCSLITDLDPAALDLCSDSFFIYLFIFFKFFSPIFCHSLQCKGSHSVNKRVHGLFLTLSIYQIYPSLTPEFVAAFYKVWRLLAHQLRWKLYVVAPRILRCMVTSP